jgi:hypothetical protein
LFQDLCRSNMWRQHDPIVHPLSLAPCRDDARAAKVSEVPGDFRLWAAENLDEVADANFLISHQVQKAEPCVLAESLEESLDIECLFRHGSCIRLDECESKTYSRLSGCEEAICQSGFWIR